MIARLLIVVSVLAGIVAFLAAVAWPTVALLYQAAGSSADLGTFGDLSSRHAVLLGRTLLLALGGTFAAILLGVLAAPTLADRRNRFAVPFALAVLFCPPYVYVFGWQCVLPVHVNPYAACIMVWGLWAWPIPGFVVGHGLRTCRSAYEAGLLSTGPMKALMHTVFPSLRAHLGLATLIVLVLLLGDYAVPHAFGLIVYATELLGSAAASSSVVDPLIGAAPLAVGIAVFLLLAWMLVPRSLTEIQTPAARVPCTRLLRVATALLGLVAFVVPIVALTAKPSSPGAVLKAFDVYAFDILESVGVGLAAGVATGAIALAVAAVRPIRGPILVWAIVAGAMPGALIGVALIAAYGSPWTWWIYDNWPIVVLVGVARFAWTGALVGLLLNRIRVRLIEQAATDGADSTMTIARITGPLGRGLIVSSALVVTALSLSELAATSLVRVPSFSPVSQVVIEKFHRFENDMLISLSLCLVALSLPAALLLHRARRD